MYKIITCIAEETKAPQVVQGLKEKFGIEAIIYHFARGFGRSSSLISSSLGKRREKMTLKVMVKSESVDDVFSYIFHTAELNRPHGGIIYVNAVSTVQISPPITQESLHHEPE